MIYRSYPLLSHKSKGLTLVELLVALVISLVIAAAISSIVIFGERHKRQLTSTNDLEIGAGYAMVQLDTLLRSAGSGYSHGGRDNGLLGCYLAAGQGTGVILPRTTAWPAPFENVMAGATAQLVLAPLLIAEGAGPNGSDVLITMRGNAAAGDAYRELKDPLSAAHEWELHSSLGFREHDLVVVGHPEYANENCLLQQVKSATPSGEVVELETAVSSRYYTPSVERDSVTTTLADLGQDIRGHITALGTLGPAGDGLGANVQFYMLGVDGDANLHRFDLLKLEGASDADNDLILADNVVALRALYGVANDDGELEEWISPQKTADYTLEKLTTSERGRLGLIVAVRVALVVRSPLVEQEDVAPGSLTIFSDLEAKGLNETFALTEANTGLADTQRYRHRVVEATIPLRNALLAVPQPPPSSPPPSP